MKFSILTRLQIPYVTTMHLTNNKADTSRAPLDLLHSRLTRSRLCINERYSSQIFEEI